MKNRRIALSLFISITAIISLSCSTVPLVKLIPEQGPSLWIDGRGFMEMTDKKITVQSAFDSCADGTIRMSIKVINNSADTILFDPALAYYSAWKTNGKDPDAIKEGRIKAVRINAYNPEKLIAGVEKNIRDEKESYETDQTINAAAGCLSAAASIGSKDGDKNSDETEHEMDDREREHHELMQTYSEQKRDYQQLIRKNTLMPGKSVEGKIYFNVAMKGDTLQFVFPVENRNFSFGYIQQNIK